MGQLVPLHCETPALILDTDPKSEKWGNGLSGGGGGFESEIKVLEPVAEAAEEEPAAAAQPSPAAQAAPAPAAPARTPGKPPKSAKKKKRSAPAAETAKTPAAEAERNENDDVMTPEGQAPPASDFEAMLAKAMAAEEQGVDINEFFRGGGGGGFGGGGGGMMNSPAAAPAVGAPGKMMNSSAPAVGAGRPARARMMNSPAGMVGGCTAVGSCWMQWTHTA
jgi:pyruvate/2-oxoglutarate dehydrogenase complex dihydrolipoamide acyltransferase (E2) component